MSLVRNLLWCSLISSACLCEYAQAAVPQDLTRPIEISADQAEFNQMTGMGLYQGHVVIIQGEIELSGETLNTYQTPSHLIEKITTHGTPATLRFVPSTTQAPVLAQADNMIFFPTQSLIQLFGHAKISQASNQYEGNALQYNFKKQEMSSPENGGRVVLTIDPNAVRTHP